MNSPVSNYLIPIVPSFTVSFSLLLLFPPTSPHLYFLQLTSPLISKMSSTGSVESGKPPKVGLFSNSDLKHLQTNKEINTLTIN